MPIVECKIWKGLIPLVALYWIICLHPVMGQSHISTKSSSSSLVTSSHYCNSHFFTPKYREVDKAWSNKNELYQHHPDAGFIDKYVPSNRAIEILDKRTKDSKYYVDKDSAAKFYVIKSVGALHYRKDGQWLTIDERLEPKNNKVFEASHQQELVGFDMNRQMAYIKSIQGTVYFNNWILYGEVNGKEIQLAKPDWSHYSIGDEGIYITNIFPGIDAEMRVGRGTIKTSFIVRQNNYTGVQKLFFKAQFQSNTSGQFDRTNNSTSTDEADYILNNEKALHISKAIAYQENDVKNSAVQLSYLLSPNELSITIETTYLNTHLLKGNVVIDPLVSTTNSIAQAAITSSMDCSSGWNDACNYSMLVPSPAKATITGVYFQFGFATVGTARNRDGYWTITSGSCTVHCGTDPNSAGYDSSGVTSTQGQYSNISTWLLSCMPPPSCVSQNIPFTLGFLNDICSGTTGCNTDHIIANEPFMVMIEGHTLELTSISADTAICQGQNANLSVAGIYGVPPYSYNWSNGAGIATINVTPSVTTSYQATITDQCNNTVTGNVTVTVNPIPPAPVVGSNSPVCANSTINLTASTITGASYSWTGPNSFTSNLQNPSINNAGISAGGNYAVTANVNNCISPSGSVSVAINSVTSSVTIQASATTICSGSSVTFTATPINGGTNPVYQWEVNRVNEGTNSSTYTTSTLNNNDAVSCIMTSDIACTLPVNSNNITMTVNNIPDVSFTVNDSIQSVTNNSFIFTNTSINDLTTQYKWYFGNGGRSSLFNPIPYSYTIAGTYSVQLFADNGLCTNDVSKSVIVYPTLNIPNAFSPNGDGINDYWVIPDLPLFNYTMNVFDRNGQIVFSSREGDTNMYWDGKYKGSPVPIGTYYYVINTGNPYLGTLSGWVVVLR